ALDVLLRPLVAEHPLDVAAAARVRFSPEHREVGAADDVLRLLPRHGVLLPVLGALAQRLADVGLAPALVDDPAAVEAQPVRVRLAAQDVLVGAANDAIGVSPVAARGPRVVAVAATATAGLTDAEGRDPVVPGLRPQVPDVVVEPRRAPPEAGVAVDRDLRPAADPHRRDAVVHAGRQGIEVLV